VTSLLAIALTLCAAPAPNWAASMPDDPPAPGTVLGAPQHDRPHPSVVRVIAPLPDGFSLGSGTLVGATKHYGLVITNWHVVRDASGPLTVVFPDGFRSGAKLMKTDRDWDLAALAIWRPNVDPVPISPYMPRPGEPLTIAGYGSGWYRAATGRCVQYVAPGSNFPTEMVELSAGARQGDSGGPIFNARGEVAGVLFGAAMGHTTGSYGGRVRAFLGTVVSDVERMDPRPAMIAEQPVPQHGPHHVSASPAMVAAIRPPRPPPPVLTSMGGLASGPESSAPPPAPGATLRAVTTTPIPTVAAAPQRVAARPPPAASPSAVVAPVAVESSRAAPGTAPESSQGLSWSEIFGTTTGEQIKSVLAGIGLIFLLVFALRTLASMQAGPAPRRRRSGPK
jgi:hypothetical protein